jgi:hypothetical protein
MGFSFIPGVMGLLDLKQNKLAKFTTRKLSIIKYDIQFLLYDITN